MLLIPFITHAIITGTSSLSSDQAPGVNHDIMAAAMVTWIETNPWILKITLKY